ncbi:MAG: tetratricopeptide repeat protein, partial [Verrucomicrobiota bacterium]
MSLWLARRCLASARFAGDDCSSAIAHFEKALGSPANLAEAKHLLANQSDIHFWLGEALDQSGDHQRARAHWKVAAEFRGDFQQMSVRSFSEMTYYSALSWSRLGKPARAKQLLEELLAYGKALEKETAKIDYFATSLPTMLLFEDDLQARQVTTARFLQAQALLGLGRKHKALTLLRDVLARDSNHALALDTLREFQ